MSRPNLSILSHRVSLNRTLIARDSRQSNKLILCLCSRRLDGPSMAFKQENRGRSSWEER